MAVEGSPRRFSGVGDHLGAWPVIVVGNSAPAYVSACVLALAGNRVLLLEAPLAAADHEIAPIAFTSLPLLEMLGVRGALEDLGPLTEEALQAPGVELGTGVPTWPFSRGVFEKVIRDRARELEADIRPSCSVLDVDFSAGAPAVVSEDGVAHAEYVVDASPDCPTARCVRIGVGDGAQPSKWRDRVAGPRWLLAGAATVAGGDSSLVASGYCGLEMGYLSGVCVAAALKDSMLRAPAFRYYEESYRAALRSSKKEGAERDDESAYFGCLPYSVSADAAQTRVLGPVDVADLPAEMNERMVLVERDGGLHAIPAEDVEVQAVEPEIEEQPDEPRSLALHEIRDDEDAKSVLRSRFAGKADSSALAVFQCGEGSPVAVGLIEASAGERYWAVAGSVALLYLTDPGENPYEREDARNLLEGVKRYSQRCGENATKSPASMLAELKRVAPRAGWKLVASADTETS